MKYDAIIIGAGPAGLLLGKELSKKHKILILEKNKIGHTDRSWITYENRWNKEKFPKNLITNRFKDWNFTVGDYKIVIKDNYICFDEPKFLKYLISKQKSTIIQEPFKKFKRKNDHIIVNEKYQTNLLIDCSGTNSEITPKVKKTSKPVYCNCYGYFAKFPKAKNYNFYSVYEKNNELYSFGVTKVSKNELFLLVFNYSTNKIPTSITKKEMAYALNNFKIAKHNKSELKFGSYPTGFSGEHSKDNIFLYGDAGHLSPSFNGMGFNEIFRQHKKIAKHLSSCLQKNKLSKKDLSIPYDLAGQINNHFMKIFANFFLNNNNDLMKNLIVLVKKIPNKTMTKIMRNTITDKEVKLVLKKLLKFKEIETMIKYLKKKYLLKIALIFLELGEELITEEVHNLVFKHHKIKIKDMY